MKRLLTLFTCMPLLITSCGSSEEENKWMRTSWHVQEYWAGWDSSLQVSLDAIIFVNFLLFTSDFELKNATNISVDASVDGIKLNGRVVVNSGELITYRVDVSVGTVYCNKTSSDFYTDKSISKTPIGNKLLNDKKVHYGTAGYGSCWGATRTGFTRLEDMDIDATLSFTYEGESHYYDN